MTDLAKLVVKLEAESAKLHKDLDRANKKLSKFEKHTGRAGKALTSLAQIGGTALGLVSAATIAMSKSVLDAADRIGKLSVATGISTESLSRLKYMAQLTGSDFASLVKGFRKMQRSMYDTNNGLITQQRAFDSLGVSVADAKGNLRDSEEVLGDVADAFSKMKDGAEKGAVATIIFGRAGNDMIPFLNQGRAGLKAMADEADSLGITMSGKLTAAAERTNDNLTRLSTAIQGVFLKVMEKAIPYIEDMTKAMVKWAKEPSNVADALGFLNNVMKVIATGALFLKGIFVALGKAIGSIAAAVVTAARGEFSAAWDIIQQGGEDSNKAWAEAVELI
jgi:hypothetical protein